MNLAITHRRTIPQTLLGQSAKLRVRFLIDD
jgi:hypothetical protein